MSDNIPDKEIRQVVEKIFYSPATNGKAEQSINDGIEAVDKLFEAARHHQSPVWVKIPEGIKIALQEIKRLSIRHNDQEIKKVVEETLEALDSYPQSLTGDAVEWLDEHPSSLTGGKK